MSIQVWKHPLAWEARLRAISRREQEGGEQTPLVYFQAGGEGPDTSLQV